MRHHHKLTKEDRRDRKALRELDTVQYWIRMIGVEGDRITSHIGPFVSRRRASSFLHGRIRNSTKSEQCSYYFWSNRGMKPSTAQILSLTVRHVLSIEDMQYADEQLLHYAKG